MPYTPTIKTIVVLFALALPVLTTAKEKKSYARSAFSNFKNLPINKEAGDNTRKQAGIAFPGWMAITDKLNGRFTDLFGSPVNTVGATLGEKVTNLLQQRLNGLDITENDWFKIKEYEVPKGSCINFKQYINGHEVVFSLLSFQFTKSGDLARIQMKNYGSPAKGLKPKLTAEYAKSLAVKDITGISWTGATVDANWAWFPIPKADGYTLHPAWHFNIKGKKQDGIPLMLTGYVDAINGEILYRDNEVKETSFDLRVKGLVYKSGTLHPATLEPLTDLWVSDGISAIQTDTGGYCTSSLWSLPLTANVQLAGSWSIVVDDPTSLTPNFPSTVSIPGTSYIYPTTAPSGSSHVNAYYHVNKIHNVMKHHFPTFTSLDFALPTNVDIASGNCNAFYGFGSINFFAADATCNSFAEMGDVVYHEYGHAINDYFYTFFGAGATMMNAALHEGCADVWGLSITHNPVMAENSYVGIGGFIRRYDMLPQVYPIDCGSGDPHKDGAVIAGCWWDLGVNLGSADSMAKLFTEVYYNFPDGPNGTEGSIFQGILINALMADDNDANLFNGTPHYNQIVSAFAKHGIFIEGEAIFYHADMSNPPAGSPITINAVLNVSSPAYMHDLTLYYRINAAGAWNAIPLTGSGMTYSCNMPSQSAGTIVEYYFAIHDSLGVVNACFPLTYNPSMSPEQITIPYQFGVGIMPTVHNNLETTIAGWHIGSNPGDDATAGLWQWNSSTVSSIAFPNGDHTTGFGQCFRTAAVPDATGSDYTGVGNGTSTLLSPVFNISGLTTPIVDYYRWFSNEQGFDNYKNDPWIVQIRSAPSGAWQTVERTYQADNAWRHRIFQVHQYLPGTTTQIQLRFIASDSVLTNWYANGQGTSVGAIDDIAIYDTGSISGITDLEAIKISVSPNPADDKLTVTLQGNSKKGTISLYDMTGKKVANVIVDANVNNYLINTQNIAPGIYNLSVETDKSVQCRNIVIAH